MRQIRFGSQSFPLAKALEEDFDRTLRRLHEIGFQEFEPLAAFREEQGPLPAMLLSFERLKRAIELIAPLGMKMTSMHVASRLPGMDGYSVFEEGILKAHEITGAENFVFSGMFQTAEDARKWADFLSELARRVAPCGLRVLYHNHASELVPVEADGMQTTALEYFVSLLEEPALLEPDIGWLGINADEVELMRKFAPRVGELHLKDFPPARIGKGTLEEGAPADLFCTIGAGGIRTREVLRMIPDWPRFNGLIVLDQDQSENDIFEDLKTGIETVSAML